MCWTKVGIGKRADYMEQLIFPVSATEVTQKLRLERLQIFHFALKRSINGK